jgi:DNA-binding IclR family transcriptional regulator
VVSYGIIAKPYRKYEYLINLILTRWYIMADGEKQVVSSLNRGLLILEALIESDTLGVSELSRMLSINKTTVFRLLSTLVARGFAEKDPETSKYRLSAKFNRPRFQALDDVRLRELSRPFVEKLTHLTGESTGLCMLSGNSGVLIDNCISSQMITAKLTIGMDEPLHCTSLGKALLSAQPEPERERLIRATSLFVMTPNTISDENAFREEIDRTAREGAAWDDEEYSLGMRCIAAPVFTVTGMPVASIGISGPLSRVNESTRRALTQIVKSVAAELSQTLEI